MRAGQIALIRADLDTVRTGGPLDAVLDGLDLVLAVPGRVVRVVDLAPGRAELLGSVDRVLVVERKAPDIDTRLGRTPTGDSRR
jgi:hypothetical protein